MTRNLAQLFAQQDRRCGQRRFGLLGDHRTFSDGYELAARGSSYFADLGIRPGCRVVLVGHNSLSYLYSWMALQLCGAEVALVNPAYPQALLADMLKDMAPGTVVWVGRDPDELVWPDGLHLDGTPMAEGFIARGGQMEPLPATAVEGAGFSRRPSDIAGYMHTSGTTGRPKFCAQSHAYYLRLGRFVADTLCLSGADSVLAPLPLFHINPLGYGVIGGLVAGANVYSVSRFSASAFWRAVRDNRITALIMHAPPIEILKRATTRADAAGHEVRIVFFADRDFMQRFDIPLGVSVYGSTEAAGLSHAWLWRREDDTFVKEGWSRYGGAARPELRWRLSSDGEIELAETVPHVLFEGYLSQSEISSALDPAGWYRTGDIGRTDERGNLVFVERRAESIRVNGEYVPIDYVEGHFRQLGGIEDVGVWRQPGALVDDEVVLFVAGASVDIATVREASAELPRFMRPAVVVQVREIPRDSGVGKIRRRELAGTSQIRSWRLA